MYDDVKMMFNAVLVEELTEKTTPSGLILPETRATSVFFKGIVRKVGPGRIEAGVFMPTTVKEDDVVMFARTKSEPMTIEGKQLYAVREDFILCILKAAPREDATTYTKPLEQDNKKE